MTDEIATLASRVLKDAQFVTEDEIQALAGSWLSLYQPKNYATTTEDDVRKMIPGAAIEFTTLSTNRDGTPKHRGISASWSKDGESYRQSIRIPNTKDGLGKAADILRQAVDCAE